MDDSETGSGSTSARFDTVSQTWSRWLRRARREPRLLFITDQKTRCKYQRIRPSQPSNGKALKRANQGGFFAITFLKTLGPTRPRL